MAPLRLVAALAIATTACVQQQYSDPSTFPEATVVVGPPGGEMDPEWGPRSSGDYADATVVEPSSDPNDPGYAMGQVTDAEIDVTLDGYGEWVETDDYGEVWRPYATEVGVDFTPYESCGSWVWTDWGWTFTCDWDWGWLPFHYGTWGWFDDYWAWVPDYNWTPAAVDWRDGGGYVGWRPKTPTIRDHRGQHNGPLVRDHRTARGPVVRDHRRAKLMDSHWRFAAEADFTKPHIRAHLFKSPAEGLRVTQVRPKLPLRGRVQAIRAASLMRNRFANAQVRPHVGSRFDRSPARPARPSFDRGRPPVYDRNAARSRAYDRAFSRSEPSVYAPGYSRPQATSTPPSRGGRMPEAQPGTVRADPTQPQGRWQRQLDRANDAPPVTQQPPVWGGRHPPTHTMSPIGPSANPSSPIGPSTNPSSPIAPSQSWQPPSSPPTWQGPRTSSPPTWSPPAAQPSAPSHTSPPPTWSRPSAQPSAPSRSYSPPSRPSSSFSPSSSGGFRGGSAPSAPARSSGGARRH